MKTQLVPKSRVYTDSVGGERKKDGLMEEEMDVDAETPITPKEA